jgi:hypothetical protein
VSVDDNDLQRLQFMMNPLELGLNVVGGNHVAVRVVAEVQFNARLKAPLQGNLIDRDCGLTVVHGRGKMIRRIKVGTVVRDQLHTFDRPPLSIGQFLLGQSRKNTEQLGHGRLVVDVRYL